MKRAVMVMFDSLNRRMLPPYGATDMLTPNFERLADRAVTFDNCYAASMPCMPARREIHTGRYNFLHRSWGPLEPFDDSVPQMLTEHGVHTHLATDHQHYWEDGGATFHNRYSTYEFFRGQEGDRWKGHVRPPARGNTLDPENFLSRQDRVNRLYLTDEAEHPETLTFDAGLHFIRTNAEEDNWFVQIETFDPHEPFFTYDAYLSLYGDPQPNGPEFDWPPYRRVVETDEEVGRVRQHYKALVSQCDHSLGRVLDVFDELDLWRDTLLIVCTDHGFFLGERGWWGKSVQPWFDETIHTPLFLWDPRVGHAGERRDELVQTIDFGPSLLDYFGIAPTKDMQGRALSQVIEEDRAIRSGGLFGNHGGHVSVTDGRYVYMRACVDPSNTPLYEYTLMPTHMRARFRPEELVDTELAPPFSFTKGDPVLKIPAVGLGSPYLYGCLLFDMVTDPHQEHPLRDDELELRMANLMVELMRANDAPADQFRRLGLPEQGPCGVEHLLVAKQWEQVQAGLAASARRTDFASDAPINRLSLRDAMTEPALVEALGHLRDKLTPLVHLVPNTPLIEVLALRPDISRDEAAELNAALEAAGAADRPNAAR